MNDAAPVIPQRDVALEPLITLNAPLVSVVLTTYTLERLRDVFDALRSLRSQTYDNIEIIFVGEGSLSISSSVEEEAQRLGMSNVLCLFNDGPAGLSEARNVAIPRARGQIIAFLDDDSVAFSDWAESLVRAFAETDAIGVSGTALPQWDSPSMAWLPEEFYWLISCTAWTGWQDRCQVRSAWGMNMAFRREAFDLAGLFSTEAGYQRQIAEDLEFSLRAKAVTGRSIIFEPTARVYHKVHGYRFSWRFVAARSQLIGRSRRLMRNLYVEQHAEYHLEAALMKRIGQLMIRTMRESLRSPSDAARTAALIAVCLSSAAYGYVRPGRVR